MSLFIRNLFFTILQPGMVAGLIPFWLIGEKLNTTYIQPFTFYQCLGMLIFTVGVVLTLICILHFAVHGRGTLSPAEPTKKMVIAGPYRFSRNPMYMGVMMMLIGESIFFLSLVLSAYSLFIFLAFHLFITYFEEPRLRKDFGDDYAEYLKKVRRWL